MNICSYIDHTSLKPDLLLSDVERLCREAIEYNFASVCIPPLFVKQTKELLGHSDIKTASVIGFPFGYSAIEAKIAEIVLAIVDGADELDMVINIAALKNNDWQFLANEITSILPIIHQRHKKIKIIIESGILSDDEIIKCCTLYGTAGIDYLKTSTGYAATGATVSAVELMRTHLPPSVGIKASGGIRNYNFAKELIDAGATRIGSSAGVHIAHEALAMQ